jgi:hypothetical protein
VISLNVVATREIEREHLMMRQENIFILGIVL